MANVDNPNGFTPVRHLSGGTIRMEEMPIAKETAAAIYSGDLVTLLGTGFISVGTASTVDLIGVFAGCSYRNPKGEYVYSKHWPAGQATLKDLAAVGYVYSDPNIVFSVQTSGTGAFADNGVWMDMEDSESTTALKNNTGRSAQEANENASSANVLRQIGLVKRPDNAYGTNADIEVMIVLHARTAAASISV